MLDHSLEPSPILNPKRTASYKVGSAHLLKKIMVKQLSTSIVLIVDFPSCLVKLLQLLGPLARGNLKEDRMIGCQAGKDLMAAHLSAPRRNIKRGPQRPPTPT